MSSRSSTAPATERTHSFWWWLLQLGVLALPILVFAYQAWHYRWMFDDGFINLRIVRQLEAGNGPVYNAGQRVEAYTSALWLFVLYVGDLLTPIRLEWIAVLTGIVASIAGLGFATAGGALLARRTEPDAFIVPFGVLIPVAVAPYWYFASSGLEGGLTFAWIGLSFFVAIRWALSPARTPRLTAVLIGLGWLLRPELVLLAIPVLAALMVGDRSHGRRAMLRTIVYAAAIPLAYQVFRMGYFAQLVPNTAIAKEASGARWDLGWEYARTFASQFHLWIALALLAAGYIPTLLRTRTRQLGRATWIVSAFVVGGLLNALYIVRVGGDYIPARLLLPALFILVTPVATIACTRRYAAAALVPVWAVFVLTTDRSPGSDPQVTFGLGHRIVTLDEARHTPFGATLRRYQRPGIYFGSKALGTRPGPYALPYTVSESGIGMVGYSLSTRVRVLDWLGLVDPMTAHFELTHRGLPGHEKPIPGVWAAAELTAPGSKLSADDFRAIGLFVPLIPPTDGAEFARQVATVRSVLRCPKVSDFASSYRAPLTAGDFLSNIADSVSNSSFVIPPAPSKAERALCR